MEYSYGRYCRPSPLSRPGANPAPPREPPEAQVLGWQPSRHLACELPGPGLAVLEAWDRGLVAPGEDCGAQEGLR
jgi:hypothetical protein